MAEIIYQQNEIKIIYDNQSTSIDVELLKKTIYGTNGPKYQHFGQELKLQNLKKPHFFKLFSEEKQIGFYCICERIIEYNNAEYIGFYGRYLTIDSNF